jgi:hypothetical protein
MNWQEGFRRLIIVLSAPLALGAAIAAVSLPFVEDEIPIIVITFCLTLLGLLWAFYYAVVWIAAGLTR